MSFPSLDFFFAYLTHRASRTYSTVLSKLSTEVLKLNLSFDRAERPLMYFLRLAAMYIRCLCWWRKPCPCELMRNSSVCALQIVKINQDMNSPKLISSNHTGRYSYGSSHSHVPFCITATPYTGFAEVSSSKQNQIITDCLTKKRR